MSGKPIKKSDQKAKVLLESHKGKTYAAQNPCTTIFELIKLLNSNG
jgi:hypothetical protein